MGRSEGTIDRAGGRDGVRGIKLDACGASHAESGPSCQFKAASYLLWECSDLHAPRVVLLAGRGSCCGSSVSSLQGGSSILLSSEVGVLFPDWSVSTTVTWYTRTFPNTAEPHSCIQYHHLVRTLVFPKGMHLYFLIIYFYNKWIYYCAALRVGLGCVQEQWVFSGH